MMLIYKKITKEKLLYRYRLNNIIFQNEFELQH